MVILNLSKFDLFYKPLGYLKLRYGLPTYVRLRVASSNLVRLKNVS